MGKSSPSILAETLRDRVVGPITRLQEEGEPASDYVAWLAPEGASTDDGRLMLPGSLTWREPPLPLMASDRTLPGHLNAVLVGNLVDLDRAERDGVTWVTARVRWDSTDEARRFRALVDCALDDGDGCAQMRGVSVDLAVMDADIRTDEELDEVDDDWPEGVWLRVRAGVILGATLVPMPAFESAHVQPIVAAATAWRDLPLSARDRVWDSDAARRRVLGDGDWDRFERAHFWVDRAAIEERGEPTQADYKLPFADLVDGTLTAVWNGVTAATAATRGARGGVDIPDTDRAEVEAHQCRYYGKAREEYDDDSIMCPHDEEASLVAAYPVAPPAAWFTHDGIDGPTPLTVTDGRVFGHAALADTCHTGLAGCTTMPADADLTMFLTGYVVCDDGSEVAVGQLTLAGGHPPEEPDRRGNLPSIEAMQRAYADTRSAVADVTAGYDEWGLWVAGALRPGVSDDEVRVLRASPLSGHWRYRDGADHLIALVAVNSQGFPVRRLAASAIVADGHVQSRYTVGPDPAPEPEPELSEAVWALVADLRQALTIVSTELTRFRAQGRVDAALDRIGG